jgi:hypothetical protein
VPVAVELDAEQPRARKTRRDAAHGATDAGVAAHAPGQSAAFGIGHGINNGVACCVYKGTAGGNGWITIARSRSRLAEYQNST